jgi:hypothetical protein
MMNRINLLIITFALWSTAGCTNFLYQGEISAPDSYGKERHFVLYWTKTDPFIGMAKAGPAILLTECSDTTRIDFGDQAEGIVFRGEPGRDRLPGQSVSVALNQICGKITNYTTLEKAMAGLLTVAIYCQPMPKDDFAVQQRNYLAARPEPFEFQIIEKQKKWSFFGETLQGPPVPECRQQ